jgi:single-strand DNA-binding protein
MNNISIVGNIGRDIETRTTGSGKTVVNFSVGVRNSRKDKDGQYGTSWFNVHAWGQTAEFVSNHLEKGMRVGVCGSFEQREYEKDGERKVVWDLHASSVESLQPRPSQDNPASAKASPKPKSTEDYDPFADD